MKKTSLLLATPLLLLGGCMDQGTKPAAPATSGSDASKPTRPAGGPADASKPADNSAQNERDRAPGAVTPIDQNENQADLEITQRIRQAIMKDDALSLNAKNVKVITADGQVTLRGPVKSATEKQSIGAKATAVAGAGKVDNQLDVAP